MNKYNQVFELAESKGYKPECSIELTNEDSQFYSNADLHRLIALTMIQKWLREEHKLHIYIDTTPVFDTIHPSKYRSHIRVPFQPFKWTSGHYYIGDTYEQAFTEGIHEAIKLIK